MTVNCSAASFSITAKDPGTGKWESSNPTGAGGGGGGSGDALLNADYTAWYAAKSPSPGQTLYVATTGSDSNPGTEAQPFLTIQAAINAMDGGDHIIIEDGVYAGFSNYISTDRVTIPNGTSTQETVIRARNPFAVWITQESQSPYYYDSAINLDAARPAQNQYIRIDGICIYWIPASATEYENSSSMVRLAGDYCTVSRCIGISGNGGRFRSFIQYSDDNSVGNLAEDCFGIGSFHYAVYGGIGGYGEGSVYTTPCEKHVCSRVFIYMPWAAYVSDPSSPFCFYGSDDAAATNTDIGNVLFANCGAFYASDVYSTADNCAWGAMLYTPKRVHEVAAVGCFAIGSDATYGIFSSDGWGPNTSWITNRYKDCFSTRAKRTATAGDIPVAFYKNTGYNGRQMVNDCVIASADVTALYTAGTTATGTSGNELRDPSADLYPMQKTGGTYLGHALYMVCTVGQRYDDLDIVIDGSSVTFPSNLDHPMWPLPYQDDYKDAITWAAANLNRGAHDYPTNIPASGTLCPNILAGDATYPYTSLTELVWRHENGLAMPDLTSGGGVYP